MIGETLTISGAILIAGSLCGHKQRPNSETVAMSIGIAMIVVGILGLSGGI